MAEYYLLKHENGRVTARRAEYHPKNNMYYVFGPVDLYDLPIPEIRMAIDVQKAVDRYRSET